MGLDKHVDREKMFALLRRAMTEGSAAVDMSHLLDMTHGYIVSVEADRERLRGALKELIEATNGVFGEHLPSNDREALCRFHGATHQARVAVLFDERGERIKGVEIALGSAESPTGESPERGT